MPGVFAWPSWVDGEWVREPTDEEIEEVLSERHRIPNLRKNLAGLSWFHARWKEPIAKLANAEMETSGHFYEARFGSRELVDDGAILCCSIYVDLNQVKAGMAPSLAESDYSGIQDRLLAWRKQEAERSVGKFHKRPDTDLEFELDARDVERLLADSFLAPIDQQGPLLTHGQSPAPFVVSSRGTESVCTQSDRAGEVIVEADSQDDADDAPTRETESRTTPEPTPAQASPKTSSGRGARANRRQVSRKIHRRHKRHRRRRASDNVIISLPLPQYFQIAQWDRTAAVFPGTRNWSLGRTGSSATSASGSAGKTGWRR